MSASAELFLKVFKDLKIIPNENFPGTEDKPNYLCYSNNISVSFADVVRMVKQYQDAVVEEFTRER